MHLRLSYAQAHELLRRIDNLADGFAEPEPIDPGSIDSFKRGAGAALAIMRDIVNDASLLPIPEPAESRIALVGGPTFAEVEPTVTVGDDNRAFSEPQFTVRIE